MNLNQPQLQVHLNGDRPDGSSFRAVLAGPYFSLSTWPPQLSVVIRGVRESDLPPGTHLFASGEEEADLVRGMASGQLRSMPMFGQVVTEGLATRDFMVANRSPDEVRIPQFSPEKAAVWQRTQEKLLQLQMLRPGKRNPAPTEVRPRINPDLRD
jgi:hypothetical protein